MVTSPARTSGLNYTPVSPLAANAARARARRLSGGGDTSPSANKLRQTPQLSHEASFRLVEQLLGQWVLPGGGLSCMRRYTYLLFSVSGSEVRTVAYSTDDGSSPIVVTTEQVELVERQIHLSLSLGVMTSRVTTLLMPCRRLRFVSV